MAAKKLTKFQKAAKYFGRKVGKKTTIQPDDPLCAPITVRDDDTQISIEDPNHGNIAMAVREDTTVGQILQFIWSRLIEPSPGSECVAPPKHLKGATSSGSFEDLITKEGNRLKGAGMMDLGRYPVASVMTKGSKFPMQVQSKPDYEGVRPGGQQFIFEAKVTSQGTFRMHKDKIKHKQIRHMLDRAAFGVPCFVLIHFNERIGNTFYDPPFTVAMPIGNENSLPVWEQFALCKDKNKEFPALQREVARFHGKPIRWHIPPRCNTLRPALMDLFV